MNLYYNTFGEGEPLVILHGLFGSSDNWVSIARQLAKKYRVILPDLRNHGRSPHHELWNYEVMADDVDMMLQVLGLTEVYMMGHSMGGKTAMTFAATFPEAVKKLIIVDIAPRYYPVHHKPILDALGSVPLATMKRRDEAGAILERLLPADRIAQFLLKNLYRDHHHAYKWRFNLDVINKQIEEVGKATFPKEIVDIPTLFIRGINSDYITDDDVLEIRRFFSDVRVETVGNAGHWIHAEQPDVVISTVLTFLEYSE